MAITSASISSGSIQSIEDDAELLFALKELKNSIIGNTWKKVEVADSDTLLRFLLDKTHLEDDGTTQLDIAGEIAVIVGALASEGSLTIRQLLEARAAEELLSLVRRLADRSSFASTNLVVSALRALRNILVSTADITWGNMWGVGRERSVVGTGLVGPESDERNRDVQMTLSGGGEGVDLGNREGKRILSLVFSTINLNALLSLLSNSPSPQIALPLYQIFARLISQPSHRRLLAAWSPAPSDDPTSNRSAGRQVPTTYLLAHLAEVVTNPKTNPKVLEAALDLLAALVKDEGNLAADLCLYCNDDSDLKASRSRTSTPEGFSRVSTAVQGSYVPKLVHIFETGPNPVQIAAAGCLASIYRAEPGSAKFELGASIANRILGGLVNLMATRIPEERTKLCFILAVLVTDDSTLQKIAASLDYPSRVLEILHSIEQDSTIGRLSVDSVARGREAAYLALTALASNLESTRTIIADSTLPVLTYLRDAINDSSYGVRAAACQLVRVLSRTVSLVRTSLMDSGAASAVVCMFANLVPARVDEVSANRAAEDWIDGGDGWSDGDYLVEITALAALCNLIADYLPLKQLLLNTAALRNICYLANHPSETLVVNALWALNNAMYKSSEPNKRTIIEALGVRILIKLASRRAPVAVNVRALGIIQNYLADATLAELSNAVDKLGEAPLFGAIQAGLRPGAPVDLRIAALGVLVNMCYGNEKLRATIVGHRWVILALVEAIDSPFDEVKVYGLKAIRNLITSNTKRPRLPILAPFRPYCIGPRVKRLADTSPSLDVSTVAISLNEILEKVRPGSETVIEDPRDR